MIWNDSFFVDKKLRIAGIIAALAFSIFILTSSSDPLPIPEPPSSKPENNSVETLAENLDEPRSIAVSDNIIFVTIILSMFFLPMKKMENFGIKYYKSLNRKIN